MRPMSASCLFRSTPPHGGRRRTSTPLTISQRFDPRPRTGGDLRGGVYPVPAAVSIHAPARGATIVRSPLTVDCWFRSTPPHGGRRLPTIDPARSDSFDPRPRTGGDGGRLQKDGRVLRFDPRPRTGGDHQSTIPRCDQLCFDPRPRTGGDRQRGSLRPPARVSIHAPARGATSRDRLYDERVCVSIHAPARGATRRIGTGGRTWRFRSTPPHGGRRCGRL